MTLKLYSHPRSSAAYRVRIALRLKQCAYEVIDIDFARGGVPYTDPALTAANPQNFVPVLFDGDAVLTQSIAIIEYLDARFPAPRLVPDDPLERARVQALAHVIASDTHPLHNLRVRRHLARRLGQDEAGVTRWCRHWIEEGFAALEGLLAPDAGRYCWADRPTLADVVLYPSIVTARATGVPIEAFPKLARIAAHLDGEAAFTRDAPAA